jgi:hypothetical protein
VIQAGDLPAAVSRAGSDFEVMTLGCTATLDAILASIVSVIFRRSDYHV